MMDHMGQHMYQPAIRELHLKLMLLKCSKVTVGDLKMDMTRRIVYDEKSGTWDVLFDGKRQEKKFKNASEAMAHLNSLISPVKKP
jgi:hypothetical protein